MKYYSLLPLLRVPNYILYILFLAFLVRILWLPQNLFFGFEQGRDLLAIKEIVSLNDLRLIGPNTDILGIFHGVLYYYLLAPLYIIFRGNPLYITYGLIFLNSAAIYFLYKAVFDIFDKKTAILSILFYTFSYSAITYSRWMSNTNLIPATTILLFYFLALSRKKTVYMPFVALTWSIMFHFSLASATILVAPIILFLLLYQIKPKTKEIIFSLFAIFALFSPYLVFEIKNNFILSKNINNYLGSQASEIDRSGSTDQFLNEIVDNMYPTNRSVSLALFFSAALLVIVKIKDKRNIFILGFILLPVIFFMILGIRPLRHVYIFSPVFISIILAVAITSIKKMTVKIFIFASGLLVILGNLYSISLQYSINKPNFLYHSQHLFLQDELTLIDYLYQDVDKKPFSYNYYSVPYWRNESWEYLFSWYGEKIYGFRPQQERTETFYVLIEPEEKLNYQKDQWYKGLDAESKLVEKKHVGKLTLEKRVKK